MPKRATWLSTEGGRAGGSDCTEERSYRRLGAARSAVALEELAKEWDVVRCGGASRNGRAPVAGGTMGNREDRRGAPEFQVPTF